MAVTPVVDKVVELPEEVTSPVKLALVVTVAAFPPIFKAAAVPVILVPTKAVGVPKAGVTKVGEVDKTTSPVPVEVVVPVPPFATDNVPVTFEVRSIEPASWSLVTLPAPIAVTPALLIDTSPDGVTAAARLVPSPTMIFPEFSAEPTGEAPVMGVLVTPVTRPLASTVTTGTEVALP